MGHTLPGEDDIDFDDLGAVRRAHSLLDDEIDKRQKNRLYDHTDLAPMKRRRLRLSDRMTKLEQLAASSSSASAVGGQQAAFA